MCLVCLVGLVCFVCFWLVLFSLNTGLNSLLIFFSLSPVRVRDYGPVKDTG